MFLVTGCNELATGLVRSLNIDGEAKGACHKEELEKPRGYLSYDIFNVDDVVRLVNEVKPNKIIHTEEVQSIEYCEENRQDSMEFNTRGTRFIAEAAQKTGVKMVLISTAHIFDGRKEGGLYTENDKINPLNVYGETKLMAEVHTDKVPGFLIVRMGELYGNYPGNFADYVLMNLKFGEKVELASDMYFSPIYIEDAVEAVKLLAKNDMGGFYNVAGPERISHYEFGRRIAKKIGFSEDLIVPFSVKEAAPKARLALDTSLDISKIGTLMKIRGIDEGLEAIKKTFC